MEATPAAEAAVTPPITKRTTLAIKAILRPTASANDAQLGRITVDVSEVEVPSQKLCTLDRESFSAMI